jgi:hypothetical protein
MVWHLLRLQRHGGFAAGLAQSVRAQPRPLPGANRGVALQVRQRECADAVAAVAGAENREQRNVLRERQHLALAEGPTLGREGETEHAHLTDEWIHAPP